MPALRFALFGVVSAFVLCFAGRAWADERRVVVLNPIAVTDKQWPEGTRQVIAELSTSGFRVLERPSEEASAEALIDQLSAATEATGAAGAVVVLREGSVGAAYVWTKYRSSVMRIDTRVTEGTVAEGMVALRVVELFRTETLWFPVPEPAHHRVPASPVVPASARRTWLWLGGTLNLSSDLARPAFGLGLGAAIPGPSSLTLELGAAAALVAGTLETRLGRVEVRTEALDAHVLFDPWGDARVGVAFGLGAGALWVHGAAGGVGAFEGLANTTRVGVFSARARLHVRSGPVSFLLLVDPGVTLPAVSIRADEQEVSRLGRPWISTLVGVGWEL